MALNSQRSKRLPPVRRGTIYDLYLTLSGRHFLPRNQCLILNLSFYLATFFFVIPVSIDNINLDIHAPNKNFIDNFVYDIIYYYEIIINIPSEIEFLDIYDMKAC